MCLLRPPDVITSAVSFIGPTSATGGGKVTNDGNSVMIVRGVCWSTTKSPDLEDQRTTDGYETGEFISSITGLEPNTLYHVRAYASNLEGTSYGKDLTFTTSPFGVPELTTKAVTGITQTTAVSGGENVSDGGEPITEKGVCWSTQTGPDISDSKTNEGAGTSAFTSNITGLTGNTTYYRESLCEKPGRHWIRTGSAIQDQPPVTGCYYCRCFTNLGNNRFRWWFYYQ